MTTKTYRWPNGGKTAATVSVLLEVWAEDRWPSYFPRTTALKPGMVDLAARQWSNFGIREGVYRLLSALARHKIKATFFLNAIVAEREPKLVKHLVEEGHHIAGHGYSQDQFLMDMSREEQQVIVKRSLDLLEYAGGQRPVGWVTPVYSWTKDTAEILAAEGLAWHADALDASLPYWQYLEKGKIVALPWCDFMDNRVLRGNPHDYVEVFRDMLKHYREGEPLGLFHAGVHCHFGGRPLMGASINEVFQQISAAADVWVASHAEVVSWFKQQNVDRIDPSDLFMQNVGSG
jgi:hypothetical protein